jgi:hypothetical protein
MLLIRSGIPMMPDGDQKSVFAGRFRIPAFMRTIKYLYPVREGK